MISESHGFPAFTSLPERAAWRGGETCGIVAAESLVKQHPQYEDAKAGCTIAAARLVMEVMNISWISENAGAIKKSNPIMVGVHAIEGMSSNKIGAMMAQWLGMNLGLQVDDSLIQINRVGHTGSSGWHRLANPALFAGETFGVTLKLVAAS